MAELEDKRSLDLALRYAEKGNQPQVRPAAVHLLGRAGAENPRAFAIIAEVASRAFEAGDSILATSSGEALVRLGDRKGLAVLEQISQNKAVNERLKAIAAEYAEILRRAVAGAASPGAQHP